jgi:glutathione S-transferase
LSVGEAAHGPRAGGGLGAEAPAPDGGHAAFAAALPKLERFQGLLDDGSPWACCGRFTIADVAATPVLHRLRCTGIPLTAIPRLATWAEACCERPAWAGVAAIAGV